MQSSQFSLDKYVKGLVSIMFSTCTKTVCNSSNLSLADLSFFHNADLNIAVNLSKKPLQHVDFLILISI